MSEEQFMQPDDGGEEMDMPMDESDPEDLDEEDDDEDDDDMQEGDDDEGGAALPEPVEEEAAVARRRAIQAIMRDGSLSEADKRQGIQNIMSGGRTCVAPPPAPVLPQPEAGGAACVHYERNCNIVGPCCPTRVFGCRICHDELSPPGHPPMNRFMVREVVCKNCQTRQAAGYVVYGSPNGSPTRVPGDRGSCARAQVVPYNVLTPVFPFVLSTGTSA